MGNGRAAGRESPSRDPGHLSGHWKKDHRLRAGGDRDIEVAATLGEFLLPVSLNLGDNVCARRR